MVNIFKNHLVKISVVLFSLFVLIVFNTKINPVLYFHEMQPPFLANKNFFAEFLSYPGGIAEYVSNFLAQFFYFGLSGSIVVCIIGILYTLSGYYFTRKSHLPAFFSLVWLLPFLLFVTQFSNYHFPFSSAIEVLFTLGFLVIFWEISKSISPFITYPILALIVYYLADSGAFALFTAMSMIITMLSVSKKKGLVYLLVFPVFYIVVSFLAYYCIFNIPPLRQWFNFLPDIPTHLLFIPDKLFYAFIYSVPVVFIIVIILAGKVFSEKFSKISQSKGNNITVVLLVSCAVIFYVLLNQNLDKHKKNIIASDYYCYNENWNEVIDIAMKDQEFDVKINTNFNRALDQSGLLFEKFFDYPQYLGPGILYPDILKTSDMALLSSDFYYDLGYISESMHWAHEAQTTQPYSIRVLKRLVVLNIINYNYTAARKYLNVLNDNILVKDFVKKYSAYLADTAIINYDLEIKQKREYSPKGKVVGTIESKFLDLVNANPSNKRALDYLQLYYLLDHNLKTFVDNIPKWEKFYTTKPTLVDQAILLYLYQTDNMKDLSIYNRVEVTKLTSYLSTLKVFNNDISSAKSTLAVSYANTYMFYIMYDSPRVTKINYSTEDITNYNR
jgi:hypothetical protein